MRLGLDDDAFLAFLDEWHLEITAMAKRCEDLEKVDPEAAKELLRAYCDEHERFGIVVEAANAPMADA